jgi:cytochrome P450
VWRDRRFYLREASRYGPIFKVCHVVRPMVCIADMRLGADVLREHEGSLVPAALPYSRNIPKGFLRYMDAHDRRAYVPLFRAAFTTAVVDEAQADFQRIIRDGLGEMAVQSGRRGIPPTRGLQQMVYRSLTRVMLGLDWRAPAARRLAALHMRLDYATAWRTPPWRTKKTLEEIGRIVEELAARAPDGRSSVMSELVRSAPASLNDPTVVGNLAYILLNGWRDGSGLFAWIVKTLGDHSEWHLRVREAASRPDGDADVPARIVRETLRLHQSEYIQRLVRRDLRIDRFLVPRGWLLRVCVWEGHRSAATFRDPERFDPDRHLGEGCARPAYSPFGASRAWCIGEDLMLTLARTLVVEISRFDWAIVADGPPELGDFHWQPSSKLRIRLARREDATAPARIAPSVAR